METHSAKREPLQLRIPQGIRPKKIIVILLSNNRLPDLVGLRNFIQVQLFVAPTVDTPASPIKKKEAVLMAVTLPPKYSPPGAWFLLLLNCRATAHGFIRGFGEGAQEE